MTFIVVIGVHSVIDGKFELLVTNGDLPKIDSNCEYKYYFVKFYYFILFYFIFSK
jgi:hypothetical protein